MSRIIKYSLGQNESLRFYGEELNERHDFVIKTNSTLSEVKLLIFLDSRGVSSSFDTSIVKKLFDRWKTKIKLLCVVRPFEITTWMTLYNFLKINKINPKHIITNMGFVDFTPKKKTTIKKSKNQINLFFKVQDSSIGFIEKYISSNGEEIELFNLTYPSGFKSALENILKNTNTLIINTPILVKGFQAVRERPSSFFKCIELSNSFNCSLMIRGNVLNFKNFTLTDSYDGVHYTEEGNELIIKAIFSHFDLF